MTASLRLFAMTQAAAAGTLSRGAGGFAPCRGGRTE